jgi:hypothetical protein
MKEIRPLKGVLAVVISVFVLFGCTEDKPWGEFIGNVTADWLDDGRKMKLTQEFSYIDPVKKIWVSPKDSVVDGASIPQAFWSVIGGPFSGKYRRASVVHDTECDRNKLVGEETWQAVHKMFYQACRCGGVSKTKAKVMYWAVYHFGPRWEVISLPISSGAPAVPRVQSIDPPPVEKQIVSLVRTRKIASTTVYSSAKVKERDAVLEQIKDQQNELRDLNVKRDAIFNRLEVLRTKEREQQLILDELKIEKDSAREEAETPMLRRAPPNVLEMRRRTVEDNLMRIEKDEANIKIQLDKTRENLRIKEDERLQILKSLEASRMHLAELKAKQIPEEELVDMHLVTNKVETYIDKKDLELAEIETLQLEDVLK